jgi:hypothetical protein
MDIGLYNPLLQAVIKNCIAVAKHPGFAMYSAFLMALFSSGKP